MRYLVLLAIACTSPPGMITPPTLDAGRTTRRDAGHDAGRDAGSTERDAGRDAGRTLTPFDARAWESAVIYFVLTDRFANGDPSNDGDAHCTDPSVPTLFHGGDFAGLVDRLDYVEELGADVVWITPVLSQGDQRQGDQCGYHGYWADLAYPDDGALEARLGGEAGLDGLIAALHGRSMRLMIDYVVNHPGRGARIVTQRPDFFHPPRPACEALGEPDITCTLAGLPDFAHENEEVADYLDGASARFMERLSPDAIRMDTVKHVPPSYFSDRWIPLVRERRPDIYLVGELLDESGYDPQQRYLDAGFTGLFDFPLRRALIQTFAQGGSLNAVADRVDQAVEELGIERARLRSTLVDNHDVPRFLSEFPGGTAPDPQRARYHLALAVLFTAPGIPQLYYGDELGMSGTFPENRRDMPAWAFDARATGGAGYLPEPDRTFTFVQRLARTRRENDALAHGDYKELWRPGGLPANVWAFFRSDGESRAIVTMNSDGVARSVTMPLRTSSGLDAGDRAAFPDGVVLTDALAEHTAARARVEGGQLVVELPPYSVAVWTP